MKISHWAVREYGITFMMPMFDHNRPTSPTQPKPLILLVLFSNSLKVSVHNRLFKTLGKYAQIAYLHIPNLSRQYLEDVVSSAILVTDIDINIPENRES